MSKLELNYLATNTYKRAVVPSAGHWPMLENPKRFWDIVNESLFSLSDKEKLGDTLS